MAVAQLAKQQDVGSEPEFDHDGEDKCSVELHAWSNEGDNGGAYDQAGDLIVATAGDAIRAKGDSEVEVVFAREADPIRIARMLRSMADILDGPRGALMVNVPLRTEFSEACGSTVRVFPKRENFLRWQDESAVG